ncbi:hypothetical protein [Dolichospermum phage Dfl-JY45]
MSDRMKVIELLWDVLAERFERWSVTFGKVAPGAGGAPSVAAWGFVTQLQELDDNELRKAASMLPLNAFGAQRNAWFVPTPNDIIDMVREVPAQGLAVQQYLRGSSYFLDSDFGRRMRVALLTVPEGRPVPRSAHLATLQIKDDFSLQRAYQLALLWTRHRARMDRAACDQLAALPPASELLAELASPVAPAAEPFVAAERHPVTEEGLRHLAAAAERLGVRISDPEPGGAKAPGL